MHSRVLIGVLMAAACGCARPDPVPSAQAAPAPVAATPAPAAAPAPAPGAIPATDPSVDIAAARARGTQQGFEWATWSPETFARAKREHRFLLVDGAAEWCHWCHVMDETTYRDPEIGAMLRERFIAIRVDVDERPDIADRYGDYGWPATVLLSPDAEELGKFRGYLPPERLRELLGELVAGHGSAETASAAIAPPPRVEALPWIAAQALHQLDGFFDDDHGGWGFRIKAPIGDNTVFELRRAAHGDRGATARVALTLDKQRAIVDPVWGGIYQYSVGSDWNEPHFEKLITFQARNLEAYARGFAASHDRNQLAVARGIASYLDRFLSAPDGGFYTNQDADVGAHTKQGFVDGHTFYAAGEAERKKLGTPWVDTHVYARENAMAITALVALAEASGDAAPLARAKRAAGRIAASHVDASGDVWHDAARKDGLLYLADHAELGLAFVRLAAASHDPAWLARAKQIAAAMDARFADPTTGAYFAQTVDKNAVGVFARRRQPLEDNLAAARLLAALGERDRAARALAAVITPEVLDHQGPWLGAVLLALDDVGAVPWPR
ncbi:MAG TPA: DUF255 domain-containing protein [Kofleriaceae bacterium]|nr:DUF255 domain-containing protein [Kofleriaceae bacterium]